MKDKIYKFGKSQVDGSSSMVDILGGKGAHLAEMSSMGLPVPPGFTIPCEADKNYNLKSHVEFIEKESGRKFFNLQKDDKPLLLSVRSGAPISMPGVLDTVLNVGLNNEIIYQLRDQGFDPCTLYGAYKRLIYTFASVTVDDLSEFELLWDDLNEEFDESHHGDSVFKINDLKNLCEEYEKIYERLTGLEFPQSTTEQLHRAVAGVANSWNSPHAIRYREDKDCADTGTAVNVQQMVFGNMNSESGTGIVHIFKNNSYKGEFLINAQGDDVVSGYRTPISFSDGVSMFFNYHFPNSRKELDEIFKKLVDHYDHDMYVEFTIQDDKPYILQTRKLKK